MRCWGSCTLSAASSGLQASRCATKPHVWAGGCASCIACLRTSHAEVQVLLCCPQSPIWMPFSYAAVDVFVWQWDLCAVKQVQQLLYGDPALVYCSCHDACHLSLDASVHLECVLILYRYIASAGIALRPALTNGASLGSHMCMCPIHW